MKLYFAPHYEVFDSIKTIEDIKIIFPKGEADDINLFIASTSGVHGTYRTLDDIQRYHTDPIKYRLDEGIESEEYFPELTVLVIHPRLVCLRYGNIEVNPDDIPYLRKLINSSIKEMADSQKGNL